MRIQVHGTGVIAVTMLCFPPLAEGTTAWAQQVQVQTLFWQDSVAPQGNALGKRFA